MANWPLRFIHASDLHLQCPAAGLAEIPDHLHDLLVDASFQAAERVFSAAIDEEAEFLVLAGDVLDLQRAGPRSLLFLAPQFQRLAERHIDAYWAGGLADPPESWPSWLPLPDAVHVFPRGRVQEFVHQRNAMPLVRLAGCSRDASRPMPLAEFEPDASGLFTVGVANGPAEPAATWEPGALVLGAGRQPGADHALGRAAAAHYPGSPQGHSPQESGAHGCTLVQVDEHRWPRGPA